MTRHAALLLLACALLSSCAVVGQGKAKHDGFFIHDVALADPDYLAELDARPGAEALPERPAMGLFAHRLSAGQGAIVAYRHFSPGGVFAVDDETFEKLTIWFKETRPEPGVMPIDGSVIVVHTRGGSAWPRSACSGIVDSGWISITPEGGALRVVVTGKIVQRGNRHPARCNQDSISVSFTASGRSLSSLTPWDGGAGHHPYEESYPE